MVDRGNTHPAGSVVASIAGYTCLLELGGKWSLEHLRAAIAMFRPYTPSQRASLWAHRLIGTPFNFESNLPDPPKGILRVRFASLDCITFIYTLIALSRADTLEQFVCNLAAIRYAAHAPPDQLDAAGEGGNMYHFAEESLLEEAVRRGWVEDRTGAIALARTEFEVRLDAIARPTRFDRQAQQVVPLRPGRVLRTRVIPSGDLPGLDPESVCDGDIVVFVKNPEHSVGALRYVLVRHVGIVSKSGDRLYFVHSSRNFAFRPGNPVDAPAFHTGVYYGDGKSREQLGVELCGAYAGAEHELHLGDDRLHAMDQSRLRTLADYASDKFDAVKLLRVCDSRPGHPVPHPARVVRALASLDHA